MSEPRSDALVFFGATGDLAYKKIFPALQAMLRRGHLDKPVIDVAKAMGVKRSCVAASKRLSLPEAPTPMRTHDD
jgi:glucose-6-phosphate 1-dehydrogenase